LGRFSLAKGQATGKLPADYEEAVPWEDLIDPLQNELLPFVEDLLLRYDTGDPVDLRGSFALVFQLWTRWLDLSLDVLL